MAAEYFSDTSELHRLLSGVPILKTEPKHNSGSFPKIVNEIFCKFYYDLTLFVENNSVSCMFKIRFYSAIAYKP